MMQLSGKMNNYMQIESLEFSFVSVVSAYQLSTLRKRVLYSEFHVQRFSSPLICPAEMFVAVRSQEMCYLY